MSVNKAICTFHSVVKLGPDFMHLLGDCMTYQKRVALCNEVHYTKLDANLFNDVHCCLSACLKIV